MHVIKKLIQSILILEFTILLCSCSSNPQKAKAKYFTKGQKYLKNGDYGDASVEFRNALRLDPRFVEAYYQLAQADLAQRNWQGAYASLQKTIELEPGRLDARLDRGRLYFAARQFDKAEDEARTVLIKEPANIGAYQLLGTSLMGEQKPDSALEAFRRVTELLPRDASSYVNLALVEISLRRFSDAEQHLKRAVTADPKSVQANIDLANFYRLQNKLPEAQEALRIGILNSPDAPPLYVDWANMLLSAGKTAEADGVLDKLRNQVPKSPEAAMAIGDFYAQRQNLGKSLVEYQRGLLITPGNLEIEKRVEELYLISDRVNEAAEVDTQLMKQAPKDLFVNIMHGRLLLAQGKQRDAIIALQKTSKGAPDSAHAHYYLGIAYWHTDSLGQASSEFQEAIKASPGFPLALRNLAQLNIAQNHPAEAHIYALELVQKYPVDVYGRMLLSDILIRRNQSSAAEEQLLVARRLAPNLANVHLELGKVYATEKKWTQAESEFQTAVQLDPSDPTKFSSYADFLIDRQQGPKAIALLQNFVSAHPNNSAGHIILGSLYFNTKDPNAAQVEFEDAIQIDPKSAQGHIRLGVLYQQKRETDAAIEQYQKALDLQPNSALLLTMVGNLYLDRGDLHAARKFYAHALEVDPNFPIANANMAWIDAQEGNDLNVALGLAQKAKSLLPEVPSISDTLGWVMYKKGNYSGAVSLLQECVKKNPDSAQFHYHLGLALVADGQKERGRTQLQAALQMNKLAEADRQQAKQALAPNN